MEKMIARCGLDCLTCPAYKATITDNDEEREKIAKMWSEDVGFELKKTDINCLGCTNPTGPHIGHCDVCEIRTCNTNKGLATCGHCDEMETCEIINNFFNLVPAAKENLLKIKGLL